VDLTNPHIVCLVCGLKKSLEKEKGIERGGGDVVVIP
jgi:hypothetical protein